MQDLKRYLAGGHSRVEMRRHLIVLVAGYWGLVWCAWLGYPAHNEFSVTTRMLSALGSFDERYNPQWYWLFSVAMVYCGLCLIPVVLYVRLRLLAVSAWGSSVGAVLFLSGCAAIMLTGLLPYAHHEFLGWQLTHLHMNAAALITASFGLGVLWHGVLLVRDPFANRAFGRQGARPYRRFLGPFLVCIPVMVALGWRIRWRSVFAGDMTAALAGMAGVPFLEYIAIWTLMVFIVWFTLALPHPETEATQ